MESTFIIDAHLDLAMNALRYGRDLRWSVSAIREKEAAAPVPGGTCTVSLPELRQGGIGLVFASVWTEPQEDAEQEYRQAQEQLAYYRDLEAQGEVAVITGRDRLNAHLQQWAEPAPDHPVGLILSLEGAGALRSPGEVGEWYEAGLRVLGPAWYGRNRYVHGTGYPGPLTDQGRELLRAMEEVGLLLDLSHLAEESFYQALDAFSGTLLCSHSNCRSLVPGDRQISDHMISQVIERDGVIGVAMDCWMLKPGWVKGDSNLAVSLSDYVNHLDHVCQLAGDSAHAALGTDLDGNFGREQSPHDLDTIADLAKIPALLQARGYRDSDIAAILHGNWQRLLSTAWPG